MTVIDIINKYKAENPKYAQILGTILFNSTFDAAKVIIEAEKEGKKITIKEVQKDMRDEYSFEDIIVF